MGSITAIVPTYNRAQFLSEAIEALRAQSRPVAEIIVWDDGSTDGTPELLAKLEKTQGLRCFRGENGGKSRALNAALQHATGDYIWICDDDDLARPDAAERLGALLDHDGAGQRPGVAAGCYARFRDDPTTGERSTDGPGYWPDLSRGSVLRHILEDIFLFQNATLVRREAYDRVGPFREDLPRSIDYDMIARLCARFPVAVTEATIFDQRKHEGARGPSAHLHAESEVERVWLANDRRVFDNLRELLPISLYAAMFDAPGPALSERAGYLQRATVYARRDDWPAALADLEAAIARAPDHPLSAAEWDTCRRALEGKHPISIGLSQETVRSLGALARRGRAAGMIGRAYARGVLWRVRRAVARKEASAALQAARFALGTAGTAALFRDLFQRSDLKQDIKERRELPDKSYNW